MAFEVQTEQFDGPLDLMLHLIQKNRLELFDLDIAVLADQYAAFLAAEPRLEKASEYLEELAGLVELKSRRLLPRPKPELPDNYEEDQRDKLVQRLVAYQAFKEAASQLQNQYEERALLHMRPPSSKITDWQKPVDGPLQGLAPALLSRSLKRALRRQAVLHPYETRMEVKEMSVEERVEQLVLMMREKRLYRFEELCQDCTSLHMVVLTFLAVLNLVHDGAYDCQCHEEEIYVGTLSS